MRYDIYGSDVYIANKIESNGNAGLINVSERTKELLEVKFSSDFKFSFDKEVFLPNVNKKISSYLISENE